MVSERFQPGLPQPRSRHEGYGVAKDPFGPDSPRPSALPSVNKAPSSQQGAEEFPVTPQEGPRLGGQGEGTWTEAATRAGLGAPGVGAARRG